MKTKPFLLLVLLLFIVTPSFAQDQHRVDSSASVAVQTTADSLMNKEMNEHHQMQAIDAFPNYHPLVVHFPIVLLIIAALFQLLSFFIYRKELSFVTVVLLFLGVLSTWLSSHTFHAHPETLTGKASEIFETHEQMAAFTWWFSLTGLLVKVISHFFIQRKWWMEATAALLLIASTVTVSIAGHHGAMLVHMEGIGPKGDHLESHHHHDDGDDD